MRCLALLTLSCMAILPLKAQIDINDLLNGSITTGTSAREVMEAVKPALSIIRQQYRLERKGDYYGRGGRDYYGETYSLGVKISNFTLLQRCVVYPWERDDDYKRINAGGKYQPDRFRSLQKAVTDSVWNNVDFDFKDYTSARTADSLIFESQDLMTDFGMPTDETIGMKSGYMIWAYSTDATQDSAMKVKLSLQPLTLEVKSDITPISVKPEGISNVLGGVFVVCHVERTGYIKVSLTGVAALNSKNRWIMEPLAKKNVKSDDTVHPIGSKKPVRKGRFNENKENSLGNTDEAEPTPIKK